MNEVEGLVEHPRFLTVLADKGTVRWQGSSGLDQTQVGPYDICVRPLSGKLFGPYACTGPNVKHMCGLPNGREVKLTVQFAFPDIVLKVKAILLFLCHVSRKIVRSCTVF